MAKAIIKAIFGTLLIISSLLAQRETVGAEFIQHDRYIDSFKTKSNILSMSYRKELLFGMRLSASLGLDYLKIYDNDLSTTPILESKNQIFIQFEGLQKINYMYIKGAVQFYSIKGDAAETTEGYSDVLHSNIYRIYEFPLGIGFTFPIEDFDFYIGLNKVYFYGTNEKEILVKNDGNETSLGSSRRRTFQSELGLVGAEATILYHFYDNLELELNFTKYEKDDYSVRLSVWGPLKRMLYNN